MSDEFLRVATKEINEELDSIENFAKQCKFDSDVSNFCNNLKGHFHKIKGLAPMMGKTKTGEIAELVDLLLKNIIDGKNIEGISNALNDSLDFMKSDMNNENSDFVSLKSNLKKLSSNI